VDKALASAGAEDVTARFRQGNRLVRKGGLAFLLPTVVRCGSFDHPAANREFLFPYASVVEASFQDPEALAERLGPTLALTAITRDPALIDALVRTRNVERLNLGPVPTPTVRWDQPHEGTLFEFLFRRRAFERREWSPT
jgi:acyl-CoA reductase-like NAD-dependent aldehyde dehydrogenase